MLILYNYEIGTKLMFIRQPEKNGDTGKLEIMIKFTALEIDMLNSAVTWMVQNNKGDTDDREQTKTMNDLKEGFYQARRKISPSLSV
jgi:hypothetical protein